MTLPDAASLERLSLADLRDLVGTLRDEVARLKGLPPRPPSRPSGMEQATGGSDAAPKTERSRRRRGAKRDRDAVSREMVVKATPPAGSRFKGYQDLLVRELTLSRWRGCVGNAG